jgi:20S proteasome subunit beta 3
MSSIMQYNGAAVIAMAGKDCIAVASDSRYGIRNQTMGCDMKKVFQMNDRVLVGLTGLATDMQTLEQKFRFRSNMYRLREEREMSPTAFSNMVSSMMYENRFGPYFCEPVIAGLGEGNKPYLCGMDLLGAQVFTDDFIVAGDCTEALYGLCESMFRPNLEPDDLFETLAQCLLSGVDRDCLAGWGCVVHVLTPEGLTTRKLKGRMD